MKLLRYGPMGHEKPGVLDPEGCVRDLSGVVPDIAGAVLLPESLNRLKQLNLNDLPRVPGVAQQDLRLGACVGQVGKCICIGLNYADHAAESGLSVPPEPVVFGKWTSALCGPDDAVQIPRDSLKTDLEVELAVVIGQGGRYIAQADAMRHVAGYCVMNDVSERDFQLNRSGTWDKGKGHDSFGPLGPWLVTADEVPNPQDLALWLELDGQRMQSGHTSTMVYQVPFLISYLSQFMSLQPGDVISTGTPPGVGMGHKPPVYLRAGQTMRLGVQGLGVQTQTTVQA
ncbi:fumarylacetoacetate hydrolase family protein [Rhodoferax sp.]|uniref:fumarylacetoacetate hydrolase family protein n=1 Tax=Rhodoferax sp. TaxID=50421 RepID=UPI0026143F73|nr:fumarylacetoacetate hydrolase family protein [Rhodoferax sp.]MDD5480560.1 fumarylacetoacetate hydrolase family protein [Rhodoferax sp.]